jgi:hypothetical protein
MVRCKTLNAQSSLTLGAVWPGFSFATSSCTSSLPLLLGYDVVHPVKSNNKDPSYIARWWWQGSYWLLSAGVEFEVTYSYCKPDAEKVQWNSHVYVYRRAMHLLQSRVHRAKHHFLPLAPIAYLPTNQSWWSTPPTTCRSLELGAVICPAFILWTCSI